MYAIFRAKFFATFFPEVSARPAAAAAAPAPAAASVAPVDAPMSAADRFFQRGYQTQPLLAQFLGDESSDALAQASSAARTYMRSRPYSECGSRPINPYEFQQRKAAGIPGYEGPSPYTEFEEWVKDQRKYEECIKRVNRPKFNKIYDYYLTKKNLVIWDVIKSNKNYKLYLETRNLYETRTLSPNDKVLHEIKMEYLIGEVAKDLGTTYEVIYYGLFILNKNRPI